MFVWPMAKRASETRRDLNILRMLTYYRLTLKCVNELRLSYLHLLVFIYFHTFTIALLTHNMYMTSLTFQGHRLHEGSTYLFVVLME